MHGYESVTETNCQRYMCSSELAIIQQYCTSGIDQKRPDNIGDIRLIIGK